MNVSARTADALCLLLDLAGEPGVPTPWLSGTLQAHVDVLSAATIAELATGGPASRRPRLVGASVRG